MFDATNRFTRHCCERVLGSGPVPAGNLFGHRDGSRKLPILLFGSHTDSVLHGGNFDGDVGSMGAIEVMRALHDGNVKTQHPMDAVIWAMRKVTTLESARRVPAWQRAVSPRRFCSSRMSRGCHQCHTRSG